jgi:hypothetical protein
LALGVFFLFIVYLSRSLVMVMGRYHFSLSFLSFYS